MKSIFFSRFAQDLSLKAWEMLPAQHDALVRELAALDFGDLEARLAGLELSGKPEGYPYAGEVEVSPDGAIAVMNVSGPLYSNVPDWAKAMFGVADLQDINHDVEQLSQDSAIETVIYNLDTPGGLAVPSSETAELIREQGRQKRTVAYSGPSAMMASAGYKIGAACSEIKAANSADIGCVGTYISITDDSEAYAKEGIKKHVIRDGKYKAMGLPGKPVTGEELELLEGEVSQLSKNFKSFVRENRPGIAETALEGQTLHGTAARNARLIDGTRRNLPLVVADEIRRAAVKKIIKNG